MGYPHFDNMSKPLKIKTQENIQETTKEIGDGNVEEKKEKEKTRIKWITCS